jgi:Mrp family chromosome partitioning ATPase
MWLLIVVPLCSLAATYLVVSEQAPVYRATMKVVVAQAGGTAQADIGSQKLSQTMSNLLESDVVAGEVIDRLDLNTTPEKLLKDLKVSFKPDSSVLDVSFDSKDKRAAVAVLADISTVFQQLVDQKLGVRSGRLREQQALPVIIATVFDPPHLQPEKVSPKPARTLAFAGALGLAAGLLLAFAREGLDARIRDRSQAERLFGAPVVGSLPKGAVGKPPPEVDGQINLGVVDAMRVLSANLQFSQTGALGSTVLVTSAQNSEGKTTVAANLAAELASSGRSVIIVDTDMRRPRLHEHLGLEPDGQGLTEVMSGLVPLDQTLEDVDLVVPSLNGRGRFRRESNVEADQALAPGAGSLRALKVGKQPQNPASVLTPDATRLLLEELTSRADYVIVDAPPLLGLADSYPLVLQMDNVLVVARLQRTTKERARSVRSTLESLGVRRVAVVLTDAPVRDGYSYNA